MSTLHSVKLIAYNYVDIKNLSYNNGDVIYDDTNNTLRVMDGRTGGGVPLATQSWVNANALTISSLAPAVSAALSTQLVNYSTTAQIASTYATQSALSAAVAGIITVIPTASTTVLGGVKVDGTSITINGSGVISGANTYTLPTASTSVLGGVKVDGTSIVISNGIISGANQFVLNAATNTTLGGVKVAVSDTSGLSLNTSTGDLSLATAIPNDTPGGGKLGGVIPDGTTITINSGIISGYAGYTLPAASDTVRGGVIVPVTANSGFTNSSGTIRLATASTNQLGGVKVDGATILINGSGVISAQITGAIIFQGGWDAFTNTPFLTNGVGTNGFEYVVTRAGTVSFGAGNITFTIGDNVIYNGTIWVRVPIGASAGTTQNILTFNDGGTGGTTPSTFNGSGALTVSYNTIGASPLAGSASLTTVGTIATGTWQGTLIGSQYGGTGVNNSPYTLTITGANRTLDQSVANGAAPTFLGTNFTSVPITALSASTITFGSTSVSLGNTVSALNGVSIGASTTSTGSFTTLTATGAISIDTTSNNQSYTTTGTATITMTSGGTGNINKMNIGATTAGTGAFTTLGATGAVSIATTTNNQSYTTTSTGTITITSGTAGSINNMSIGGTTAAAGTFTGVTVNSAANTPAITTAAVTLTSTAWTTSGINCRIQARTYTDTSSLAGSVAASYINAFSAPTFSSTNAITIADAANLYVAAPVAGSGSTLTQASAILTNGVIKSTLATGTAPFIVASTTQVTNLNASQLVGATWASPATLGSTTPAQVNATNIVQFSSGVHYFQQPTPTALTTSGATTLTIAYLLTTIITYNATGTGTWTLPTGALSDSGILSAALPANGAFNWYIINLSTGVNTVTLTAAASGHTLIGNPTVAISSQAAFRTVKTAASTFVTYRIS